MRLVLRGALAPALVGVIVGLPLTVAAGRFLGAQLYGMSAFNPAVLFAATAALVVAAIVASSAPALRASRISPVDALRAE
jgi:ABC-type antimicrobial peptide transport system permease subunit